MKGKDLLSISDLTGEEIRVFISRAIELKDKGWLTLCAEKTLALIFEKPSLRTRVSFEVAMRQLGGNSIYLSPAEVGLGKRESIADVARVLSRYVDVIAARTFAHKTVEDLGKYASVPVINALSDFEHPCQALADLMTINEKKGRFARLNLAYIGDGNNVANSLVLGAALVGMNSRITTPPGYALAEWILHTAQHYANDTCAEIVVTEDPCLAAKDADVIYTDVWTSMGQEDESEVRHKAFAKYQINAELVALAKPDAILMHPLPAHYGEEVATGILETPQSVIFDQAENRMHVQKALMAEMLGGLEIPLAPRYR